MPFFSKNKKGEWKLLKGEIPLKSRNGGTEGKTLAVLAPFDDEGLAMHVQIVEPDSIVIAYGEGFRKLAYEETIVRQSDFFLQNRKTLKITLIIFVRKNESLVGRSSTPQKAEEISSNHETPQDDISLGN